MSDSTNVHDDEIQPATSSKLQQVVVAATVLSKGGILVYNSISNA
jgi:hypothetical protein